MSWLTRLKQRFNKSQEEFTPVLDVDSEHKSSPFAALIETPEETSTESNANVKDVFVITDATPSEPDTLGIINPATMEIRVRNTVSGEFNTVYRWQGPAIEEYIPIWGDWSGNGITSLGLYHPASGYFNLFSGLDTNDLLYRLTLEQEGQEWRPLAGDWDGDGRDGVGLYNSQTGEFLLCNELDEPHVKVDIQFKNENHRSGDLPIAGDWNGNGIYEVGVYNPTHGEFTLYDSFVPGCKFSIHPAHNVKPEWKPLSGDWLGIGFDSIGLYDNEAGACYLLNPADDQEPEIIIPVLKNESGDWRPFALKELSTLDATKESQGFSDETADAREETAVVDKTNALIKAKKLTEALNEVEHALKTNRTSGQLWFTRGKLASKLKRYDLAELSFRKSISNSPDNFEALIELIGLAEWQKKWDKALQFCNLCVPKNMDRKQKLDMLSMKGEALCKLGYYEKAKDVYERLTKYYPGQYQGWFGLGNIARLKGEWAKAKAIFQDCVNRFPRHRLKTNWLLLMAECMFQLREFEEASSIYSCIPEKHPCHIHSLEGLGKIAMASKDWDCAITFYEKCSSLLPENNNKILQLRLTSAKLMIESGRYNDAEDLFHKLLTAYPKNARVKKEYERLTKLGGIKMPSVPNR